MNNKEVALSLALLILLLGGCSKEGNHGGTSGDAQQLIEKGWTNFEVQYYDSAYIYFLNATDIDPNNAEAWLGLGWASLKLYDLSLAHQSFTNALSIQDNLTDAKSGLAIGDSDPIPDESIYQSPMDTLLSYSIHYANQVIQEDPNYVFAHDHVVDAYLLTLVKARAMCSLGWFSEALSTVQEIEPDFQADVSTPEGRSALISEIEYLIDQHSNGMY